MLNAVEAGDMSTQEDANQHLLQHSSIHTHCNHSFVVSLLPKLDLCTTAHTAHSNVTRTNVQKTTLSCREQTVSRPNSQITHTHTQGSIPWLPTWSILPQYPNGHDWQHNEEESFSWRVSVWSESDLTSFLLTVCSLHQSLLLFWPAFLQWTFFWH